MQIRTAIPILSLALLALSACSDQRSAPLTPDEQRVANAYAELLILNELHRANEKEDSLAYARKVDSVLARYRFQRGEFEAEFLVLSETPRKFKSLFDSTEAAVRELRRRQIEERDQ